MRRSTLIALTLTAFALVAGPLGSAASAQSAPPPAATPGDTSGPPPAALAKGLVQPALRDYVRKCVGAKG